MTEKVSANSKELRPEGLAILHENLQRFVHDYLLKHPGLSMNALALRAQVSGTTLRRMMDPAKVHVPGASFVLNLICYITKIKKVSLVLKNIDGPIGDYLRTFYKTEIYDDSNEHSIDCDLIFLMQDFDCYLIYKLAANYCGVSKSQVFRVLGEKGIAKLSYLITKAAVYSEDQKYYHAKEKNFSIPLELSERHLPRLVEFYRSENLEKGRNLFYSLSESLNEEGVKMAKSIIRNAVKQVYDLSMTEQYKGNIPFFSLFICDEFFSPMTIGEAQSFNSVEYESRLFSQIEERGIV